MNNIPGLKTFRALWGEEITYVSPECVFRWIVQEVIRIYFPLLSNTINWAIYCLH